MVREPDATMQPTPQDIQLMSKRRFSASSRNFDLNGEARTARTKQNSPIIPPAEAIPSRHQLGLGFRYTQRNMHQHRVRPVHVEHLAARNFTKRLGGCA